MIRIYRSPVFVPRVDDPEHPLESTAVQRQSGLTSKEHAVVVSAEILSITDSAEEISFYMAERVEQKYHAERKINPGPPAAYTAEHIRQVPPAQQRVARFGQKAGAGEKAIAEPGPWTAAKVHKPRR
jgi:hypothetical protein